MQTQQLLDDAACSHLYGDRNVLSLPFHSLHLPRCLLTGRATTF